LQKIRERTKQLAKSPVKSLGRAFGSVIGDIGTSGQQEQQAFCQSHRESPVVQCTMIRLTPRSLSAWLPLQPSSIVRIKTAGMGESASPKTATGRSRSPQRSEGYRRDPTGSGFEYHHSS